MCVGVHICYRVIYNRKKIVANLNVCQQKAFKYITIHLDYVILFINCYSVIICSIILRKHLMN